MKIKAIIFLISMFTTMAIFMLIKMLFFHEGFIRSLTFAIPAGLGAAFGRQLYINYLKRKATKQSN